MLAILTSLALGSTITGRIDLPKDRPAEHIQIRLMQDKDDPATLATSEIAPPTPSRLSAITGRF